MRQRETTLPEDISVAIPVRWHSVTIDETDRCKAHTQGTGMKPEWDTAPVRIALLGSGFLCHQELT